MAELAFNSVGKRVRLGKILGKGASVIFAFDHGVEHGPSDFTKDTLSARAVLEKAVDLVDAVMLTPGIARLSWDLWGGRTALIVKVTGKTSLRPEEQKLLQSTFGSVNSAVALGADAVAATVYWGSQYEDAMLDKWFSIKEAADSLGLPCLQLAYPRGPAIKNIYDVEVVKYGARAAAESGADLIKTYYTGDAETFAEVVKSASGIPVLMSGGPKRSRDIDFLVDVFNVMRAGGKGVVVGRNVFQHRNPRGMLRAINAIVHEGRSPEEAAKLIE